MALTTLKKRRDFLRLRRGRRFAAPGVVVQGAPHPDKGSAPAGPRVGFTVTKRLGNAVTRNRIRRRLRAAAIAVLGDGATPMWDFVLIGREATLTRSFPGLIEDLRRAIAHVTRPEPRQRK